MTKQSTRPAPRKATAAQAKRAKEALNLPSDDPREVILATSPLTFQVRPRHIKRAECDDPRNCVIAQALTEHFADIFEYAEVGSHRTVIVTPDRIVKYLTGAKLRNGLVTFDITKKWPLPPGEYTLYPYRQSPDRLHLIDKNKPRKKRAPVGIMRAPQHRRTLTNIKLLISRKA